MSIKATQPPDEIIKLNQLVEHLLLVLNKQDDAHARVKLENAFLSRFVSRPEANYEQFHISELDWLMNDAAQFLMSREKKRCDNWKGCKDKIDWLGRSVAEVSGLLNDKETLMFLDNYYANKQAGDECFSVDVQSLRQMLCEMRVDLNYLLCAPIKPGADKPHAYNSLVEKLAELFVDLSSTPFSLSRHKEMTSAHQFIHTVTQHVNNMAASIGAEKGYSDSEVHSTCEAVRRKRNKENSAQ